MLGLIRFRSFRCFVVFCFVFSLFLGGLPIESVLASAGEIPNLPAVSKAKELNLVGISVNPDNHFDVEFHLNTSSNTEPTKKELHKLINLFIASLSFDAQDLWVNLSPYEKDRVISDKLARTEFGEVLLKQDAYLKKLSASLTHPDTELGKAYWQEMNSNASNADIANKIWIIPENSEILAKANSAFITSASLKLDNALDLHAMGTAQNSVNSDSSSSAAKVLLPELYKRVNNSPEFKELRQLYNAVILGRWFRNKYINSSFNKLYGSKSIAGIDKVSASIKTKVYSDYVKSFKEGVYNFKRKEIDKLSGRKVKKNYFSGGIIPVADPIIGSIGAIPDYDATIKVQFKEIDQQSKLPSIDITNAKVPLYVKNYFDEAAVYQPQLVAASALSDDGKRFVQIHGHFYQPPRENPWTGKIPYQKSAFDRDLLSDNWNEVISRECYRPNAEKTPIYENDVLVNKISNYAYMSFNIGPTLISWMRENDRATYDAIVAANKEAYQRTGHPSALAQVYNHMIMPLANEQDKITQVKWALEDYKQTYGMDAEGIWLGETAIDIPTIEVLADQGIKFTILSPGQALKIKHLQDHSDNWADVNGARIDPKKPYLVKLPSGKEFTIFFYDGPVSAKIGFQGLLKDGYNFADQLMNAFVHERDDVQFVNVATDGESYGHHEKFGNVALSYAIDKLSKTEGVELALYGEMYEKLKPDHEVVLHKESAWSCGHGVGRWKEDCGCEKNETNNQQWRKPLRESFDYLRDSIVNRYVKEMSVFTSDPWKVRNEYINIINDPSKETYSQFFKDNFTRELNDQEKLKVLRMLEMQRNALLMYTSCAWFFEDVGRLEPMQNVRYAARVIQLAKQTFDIELEDDFLKILRQAKSNKEDYGNGVDIYFYNVRPDIQNVSEFELALFKNAFDDFNDVIDTDPIYKNAQVNESEFSKEKLYQGLYKAHKNWYFRGSIEPFWDYYYEEYVQPLFEDNDASSQDAKSNSMISTFMDYVFNRSTSEPNDHKADEIKRSDSIIEKIVEDFKMLRFSEFDTLRNGSDKIFNIYQQANNKESLITSSALVDDNSYGGITLSALDSEDANVITTNNERDGFGIEAKIIDFSKVKN